MSEAPTLRPRRVSPVERLIERTIFGSRWLLAPFYLGLILALVALLVKFAQHVAGLFAHLLGASGSEITVGVLSLIDLSLVANLLLIVMFSGYEIFVSKLDAGRDTSRLDWMGQVGFGDLKLKLMASLVAISGVRILEDFVTVADLSNRDLAWLVGIHLTFVVSGVLLALMDRLAGREGH